MKQNNGFISIFIVLILVPLLTFALFIVDYSKIILAKQTIYNVNDVAITNVLSHYNKQLQKTYGLFAMPNLSNEESIKKEIIMLMVQATRGSLNQQKAKEIMEQMISNGNVEQVWTNKIERETDKKLTNINAIFLNKVPTINAISNTTLMQSPVLKQQIVEYMKFRGPISLGYGIYNKILNLKGKDKVLESEKYRIKYEEVNHKYIEKLKELSQLYNQLNSVITNENAYFLAKNSHELVEKIKKSVSEKYVLEEYRNSKTALHKMSNNIDEIIEKWKTLKNDYENIKQRFNQWQQYVKSGQLDEADRQQYEIEINQIETTLSYLNGQDEVEQLEKLKQEIKQFEKILNIVTVNDKPLEELTNTNEHEVIVNVPNFENYDITRWKTLNGYNALISQFYKKGNKVIDYKQQQTIEYINQYIKHNKNESLQFDFPKSVTTVMPQSPSDISQQNFIAKSIQVLNNSLNFLRDITNLNDSLSVVTNELLVMEYATEMFSNYLDRPTKQNVPLSKTKILNGTSLASIHSKFQGAEVEYILYGKATAQQNVGATINAIKLFRFGLNLAYSFMDSEIRNMIIASSTIAGPLAPLMKVFLHVLLSYCETEVDSYLLLQGKAVPIFKSTRTWVVKPTQAVNGILSLSTDYILNRINSGIDSVGMQIYKWFENVGDNVEKKVVDMTNNIIDEQVSSIMNIVYNAVQKPIIDVTTVLSNGVTERFEQNKNYYKTTLDNIWQHIINNVEQLPVEKIKIPLKELLNNKKEEMINYVINEVEKWQKIDVSQRTVQYLEPLNKYIRTQLESISNIVKKNIESEVGKYKQEVLTIIGKETNHLSETVKSKLYDLSTKYFSTTMNNSFVIKQTMPSLTALSYPEYLKLFMLLALITEGNKSTKYERMAILIGKNLNIDLSQLYTAYEIKTYFNVENLFLKDWFVQDVRRNQTVSTIWGY